MLTITPDFNHSGVMRGTSPTWVRSEHIVDAFEQGEFKVGDPIIGYHDPSHYGDARSEFIWGYSAVGKIIGIEVENYAGEKLLKIWAHYE